MSVAAAADAEAADDDLDTQTEAEPAAPSAWWGVMWCGVCSDERDESELTPHGGPVFVVNLDD